MGINQDKWKSNQDKVAFLRKFPGLIQSWDETLGQKIQSVIPLNSDFQGAVLTFSNGNFVIAGIPETEPKFLREGIESARSTLEKMHPDSYVEYDVLARRDREASRIARLENIMGAINNNLDQIPELRDRIRSLVKEWNS